MGFSRREFLGLAAGSAALGATGQLRAPVRMGEEAEAHPSCTLLDCGDACTIRESLAGYESALVACNIPYRRIYAPAAAAGQLMIVPATNLATRFQVEQLKTSLGRGSTVLLESGATFVDLREFDIHRRLIELAFGIKLGPARRLWETPQPLREAPYISYDWPAKVKVRDFSRLIPVRCQHGETIARFQEIPVALRRRVGDGTLVFLGSPLGPHLWAGDREAQAWLGAFCSFS